jgi:hypothetical protein
MQIHLDCRGIVKKAGLLLIGIVVTVGVVGCTLDGHPPPPDLSGPSEHAISISMDAIPDLVRADGASTAVISVVVRGKDGQPLGDRLVFFQVGHGSLSSSFAITNGSGAAAVIYTAPNFIPGEATDFVFARTVDQDFNGQFKRYVEIELH